MSGHLSAKQLRAIAQIADLGRLDQLDRAVQAIIEGKSLGESSLDGKIVATFEGVAFTEANFLHETIVYGKQTLKRHRNGGGWVPADQDEADIAKPFVDETAYVGPWAQVSGNARVSSHARVTDYAYVFGDAWVHEHAVVSGNDRIFGTTEVWEAESEYQS
jgi:hypothetical protein